MEDLYDFLAGQPCTQITVKRGGAVFLEGQTIRCLYLIERGSIALYRDEAMIGILGPGNFFGEIALINKQPVSFTAIATNIKARLLKLDSLRFDALMEFPDVCRAMLDIAHNRCTDAWAQIGFRGHCHVKDKALSSLAWLSGRIGVRTRLGVRIDLNQVQIAELCGCTREALAREIAKLRRRNIVLPWGHALYVQVERLQDA